MTLRLIHEPEFRKADLRERLPHYSLSDLLLGVMAPSVHGLNYSPLLLRPYADLKASERKLLLVAVRERLRDYRPKVDALRYALFTSMNTFSGPDIMPRDVQIESEFEKVEMLIHPEYTPPSTVNRLWGDPSVTGSVAEKVRNLQGFMIGGTVSDTAETFNDLHLMNLRLDMNGTVYFNANVSRESAALAEEVPAFSTHRFKSNPYHKAIRNLHESLNEIGPTVDLRTLEGKAAVFDGACINDVGGISYVFAGSTEESYDHMDTLATWLRTDPSLTNKITVPMEHFHDDYRNPLMALKRIKFVTELVTADPAVWRQPDRVEIQMSDRQKVISIQELGASRHDEFTANRNTTYRIASGPLRGTVRQYAPAQARLNDYFERLDPLLQKEL